MAFEPREFRQEYYMPNRLGIPPHDYVLNIYDGVGNLVRVDFYFGGQQDQGELVGQITLTYDGSGNLLSTERTV